MQNTDLAFGSYSDFGFDRNRPHSAAGTDAVTLTELSAVRSARIASVIAEINENFADQHLSTRVVAERLGLSVRYVQDLLQGSGLSITDRIMELRLAKARAMLMQDRQRRLKIGEVAASCGFNELSYFHRSFRRRFGTSPARFRIQSMNG